jgi:GntR family transcriptional regulator
MTLTEAAHHELRQAIARGKYRPGSKLPTEAELVELLGVSRTVVREALRALEEDGLVTRRHGVGTFVRRNPILKNLNLNFGITEMIESAGLTPGTSFLTVRHEAADAESAAQLDVSPGTPLVTIERVRTADGRPVVYSLDTFAETLVRGRDFDPNRLLKGSLYQILQTELGQVIEYGITRILAAKANALVAEKLNLPEDSVVLYIVQTDYSPSDEPVLYSREYHLPDAFDFVVWRKGPTKLRSASPSK